MKEDEAISRDSVTGSDLHGLAGRRPLVGQPHVPQQLKHALAPCGSTPAEVLVDVMFQIS